MMMEQAYLIRMGDLFTSDLTTLGYLTEISVYTTRILFSRNCIRTLKNDLHTDACVVSNVIATTWNVAHFVTKKIVKTNFIKVFITEYGIYGL